MGTRDKQPPCEHDFEPSLTEAGVEVCAWPGCRATREAPAQPTVGIDFPTPRDGLRERETWMCWHCRRASGRLFFMGAAGPCNRCRRITETMIVVTVEQARRAA